MVKNKCSICGSTKSIEWHKCVVCGNLICDDCGIECDKCKGRYCIGKCGDDYIDEYTYRFCYKCK